MTYVAFGPLGPRGSLSPCRGDLVSWQRLGPVLFGHEPQWDVDLNLYPNKDAAVLPRTDSRAGRRTVLRDVAPADVASRLARCRRRPPTTHRDRRTSRHLDLLRLVSRRRRRPRRSDAAADIIVASRSASSTSRAPRSVEGRHRSGYRRDGCCIHHGVAGELPSGFDPTAPSSAVYSVGALLLDPNDPSRVLDRTDRAADGAADRGRAGRHGCQRRLSDRDRRDRRPAVRLLRHGRRPHRRRRARANRGRDTRPSASTASASWDADRSARSSPRH